VLDRCWQQPLHYVLRSRSTTRSDSSTSISIRIRSNRRSIVTFLNNCPALPEDLLRYRGLWISLSKWLHPGDFVDRFPRVAQVFDDLRNNRIKSFESQIINAPSDRRIEKLLERPSLLLRKLTWLLKDTSLVIVLDALSSLIDRIDDLPLPLLASVYFTVKYDGSRVVINKKGTPYPIEPRQAKIDVEPIIEVLDRLIIAKLAGTKDWDTVWIDPALDLLVLPLQSRQQSDGLLNIARGSWLPIEDIDVIDCLSSKPKLRNRPTVTKELNMSLSEIELREFLTRNNVDCRSLKLLWEIDSSQVYRLTVDGAEAIDRWNYLRELMDRSNYYPLLLGDEEKIERHQELLGFSSSVSIDEIIDRAATLDSDEWFREKAHQMYEDLYLDDNLADRQPLEVLTKSLLGNWKDDIPANEYFTIPFNISSRQPLKKVTIALIPTQVCWH
jgi:hypothetical protein